jgi:6-phosphogluconate dehydrogenase
MKIGFIGLGRMGYNMVDRLLQHKIDVVAYNRDQSKVRSIARKGAIPAKTVDALLEQLPKRKIIWLMLPAGEVTEVFLKELLPKLNKGDIVIDGANDFFGNAQRHAPWFAKRGIHFFDCGVSGGIWGLKNGYTLMVGGPKAAFKVIEPLCKALAPKNGYGYFGETGAGHFVKSVHNIIEYQYLQGLAEGVELLNGYKQKIDIPKAVNTWRAASVVRSWLLDLTSDALRRPDFKTISPKIDSVTIEELQDTVDAVKGFTPGFDVAVKIRRDQSSKFTLGKRTIAAVRREFGGHGVSKKK